MSMEDLDKIFEGDLDLDNLEPTPNQVDEQHTDDFNILDDKNLGNNLIDELLKSKGIEDSTIKIVNEDGAEESVNFYDLSIEEQREILLSNPEPESDDNLEDYELDESEIELIGKIRESNMTVEDYLNSYKEQIISELGDQNIQTYDIDAYNDQELFLLDLKTKYEDLTDDELVKELEKELQDEELFQKKVNALRKEYKDLEDEYKEAQKQEFENQRQRQYDEFSETMIDVAVQTPDFYGIELDDNEKNEILSSLLDLDESGTSEFDRLLSDPNKLYELAWFARYGKESFDAFRTAYESEIQKLKKLDKPNTVIKRDENNFPLTGGKSIHDIF